MEKCDICGADKVERPAGISKRTGKPYEAFMACPNYREHPKTPQNATQGVSGGNEEVLDACRKIYVKLEEILKAVTIGE